MADTALSAVNPPTKDEPGFVRAIGLFDGTMIVVGSMIGSGVFIVAADITRLTGSAGGLLLTWILTGLLTISAALAYGELAALFPHAGGQYVYLREAYGPLWGFLYGWTMFLVIQTGTIAAVAMAFAKFLGVLVPAISEDKGNLLFEYGHFALYPKTLVAMAVLVFLTWSNCTGLKTGKLVQNIFTITKIASLLGLIVLGICVGANGVATHANFGDWWTATFTQPVARQAKEFITTPLAGLGLLLALGTAMVGSLFSCDSWNNVTFTAGEVKNPKRNLPLSLFFGVTLVSALYFLANVA